MRYSIIEITGWEIHEDRHPAGPRAFREHHGDPLTTWYVIDEDDCGRVVAWYWNEHDARQDKFRSNAEERAWEKQREQLLEWIEEHP